MTKISLLTFALFCAAAPSFAQDNQDDYFEAASIALADMRCDINDERRLRWDAMNQEVILRTKLTKDSDEGFPTGQLSIILENGTEIDLGGGGKYYDETYIEVLTDCEKHLGFAIGATVSSLSGRKDYYPHLTLKSLMEEIDYGKNCVDADGRPKDEDETAALECEMANYLHERFTEELPHSGLSDQALDALRDANAPLITINRSAYYSETAVYDARSNKIHVLYYEGC